MSVETRVDAEIMGRIEELVTNIERVFFGKREVIKLCVAGVLAKGHLLIEDVPGIGKTTIAQSIAKSMDCSFNRIQFTSDMLPSDIIGVSILDHKTNDFTFREGPIFASVVLADEINRTPPKTQSALLEAMGEYQVSVDGKPHELPRPFIVMATQNPVEYEGTYILPESQLDRFMIRVEIGYPPLEDELRIVRRRDSHLAASKLEPVITIDQLLKLQDQVSGVTVDESVARYMIAIIRRTREHEHIQLGVSPRGALALYEACQARALVEGRDFVTPDDVVQMARPVLAHRILVKFRGSDLSTAARERARIIRELVKETEVPV